MQRLSKFACLLTVSLGLTCIPGCGGGNSDAVGGGGGSGGGGIPPATSHLVIILMQNHSFDNLFGAQSDDYGTDESEGAFYQVDQSGNIVTPTLLTQLSTPDLNHDRNSYVAAWDGGAMDKYAYTNGDLSMQYYNPTVSGLAHDNRKFGIGTLWGYASDYVLEDNFFASAMNSEPANYLYMVAATIHDDPTSSSLPYYDRCSAVEKSRNGGSIAAPLTETTVGDQLTAKNVSWVWYQENFNTSQDGTCTDYDPRENVFQYFTSTANSSHIQNFTMSGFQSVLDQGTLPSVVWIQGDANHGMHPGAGNILDGIEWLDDIVQAIKKSSAWPSTAIVILWDESGGWFDHVAPPQVIKSQGLGARVPLIVISTLGKAAYETRTQMDFVSILRFIHWNWKLGQFSAPAQAAREQQSGDICDLFTVPCGSPGVR